MEDRITRNQFVETVFKEKFGSSDIKLEGGTFRYKRIRVAGREMTLAHIIGSSQRCVYENLALHIGVHEGEDHTGESIGLMHFSPWETTAVAADIANKPVISQKAEIRYKEVVYEKVIPDGPQ